MPFDILASILLLASFVFIAPLRYDGDQIFSFVACMVIVSLSAFYQPKRFVDMRLPAALLILAASTTLWQFAWFKVYAMVVPFVGFLAVKVIAERTDGNIRRFGWVLLAVCLLSWIHVKLQIGGFDLLYSAAFQDNGGVFGKPWALGCFGALAIPFLFTLGSLAPAAALPILWYSHSSICVAAGLFGWWLCMNRKWKCWSALLLPFAIVFYLNRDGGVENHRVQIWKNVWPLVMEHPWFGRGYAAWKNFGFVHFINGEGVAQPWAHNDFYQTLFELGLVGLLLLLGWLMFLWVGVRRELKSALMVLSVLAFFHPMLHWGRVILLPLMIAAFCVADSRKNIRL